MGEARGMVELSYRSPVIAAGYEGREGSGIGGYPYRDEALKARQVTSLSTAKLQNAQKDSISATTVSQSRTMLPGPQRCHILSTTNYIAERRPCELRDSEHAGMIEMD